MNGRNPPFNSALAYSVQNEDYETELEVIRRMDRAAPLRVLLVASSGENALSVLTQDRVGEVWAVDLNPAQIHLCELRAAAVSALSRDDQLRFLGSDPGRVGAAGAEDRLALFDRVSGGLPEASRLFWSARRDAEIAFGVQHVGRNDVLMHDIQDHLRAAGFDPLGRPVIDAELGAWTDVYAALMTPAYIRDMFGLPSEALAARIAGISRILGECHFRALQQPRPERNPFVTTVFANAYASAAGEAGLPLYLQMQGQAALRRLGVGSRLRLVAGNVLEQMRLLASASGPFDLISLSNIPDWMTDAQFGDAVAAARASLTPGGALLARTATGSPMIQQVMERGLRSETGLNARLAEVERGPWFRTIAAGFNAQAD